MPVILKILVFFVALCAGLYCSVVLGFSVIYLLEILYNVICKSLEDAGDILPIIICAGLSAALEKGWEYFHKYHQRKKVRKSKIVSPFCSKLVERFDKRVDEITPPNRYLREGRQAAQRIFEALKKSSGNLKNGKSKTTTTAATFKIAKTKIAGSFSKHTGILYKTEDGKDYKPDLDLVVFLNNAEPPFDKIYAEFKAILEKLDGISDIKVKQYSMKFYIKTKSQGCIKVDLLAATNHVKSDPDPESRQWMDVAQQEANRARDLLEKKQNEEIELTGTVSMRLNHLVSASFALCTVKVIDFYVSDPFVLKIVKLAKFWASRVSITKGPNKFPPRSCMIEVIAIYTQRKKYGRQRNQCIISGFKRFLKAIQGLAGLDIRLTDIHNSVGDSLPWTYTTPMVVDPVNHFNNLADGLHEDVIRILQEQAEETLNVLERLRVDGGCGQEGINVENAIEKIFAHKE